MEKGKIPKGLEHIGMVSFLNRHNRQESEKLFKKHKKNLEIFGTSLSAIYQAATCHRKCHGGSHIFEAILGRTYNLAVASYSLISIGFYDEAMVMVRSIGEIANIISLSVFNKSEFSEWLKADKNKHIKDFSPAKIRKLLKDDGALLMDADWYSNLCEKYTHISADTSPNYHDGLERNITGGLIDNKKQNECLDQLIYIVCSISLFACKYFEFDDIFDELSDDFMEL